MDNVIKFPETENVSHEETVEETPTTTTETTDNTSAPITQSAPTLQQLQSLMKQVKELMEYQESLWTEVMMEFAVNSTHMRVIVDYNETNRIIPDGCDLNNPDSFPEDFDYLNGLDNIPEEKLIEVFGEDAKIFGVDRSQTLDRLKWAAHAFYDYMRSLFEFNNITKEYSDLIEENERASIQAMRDAMDKEEDPEKKASIQKYIDDYFYFKNLDFLADIIDEKIAGHIIKTFAEPRKIQYIIDRTKTALKRLGISEKFILEIAQFEKLFLDEKYHQQSNLLLVYFMNLIVFNTIDDKSPTKKKVISFVVNIDKYIRKALSEEDAANVLKNVLALEDQFVGKIAQSVKEI